MTGSRRVVLVVGLIGAFVVATMVTNGGSEQRVTLASGPRVGGGSGSMTAWYCAEGTANPTGRADEEIVLGNVGSRPSRAVITVFGGSDVAPVRRAVAVAPGQVSRVPVAEIAAIADPGVLVEVQGGAMAVEHQIRRGRDVALGPCAREPMTRTHFAAGTTVKGAELWLALFNPFPDDAIVDVQATTGDGARAPGGLQGIVVPRFTRVSVPVHDLISRIDLVAINASVRRGRAVVEQSLSLDGTDGRVGLALSLGADLAREWWFPLGLTGSGHQEKLVLANPSNRDVPVTVRFSLDAAAAIEPVAVTLPAGSAASVDLSRVPPDIGFSAFVRSRAPIVAEMLAASRAPRPETAQGLASDLGFTSGAPNWVVVPSRLGADSTDHVALVATDRRRQSAQVIRTDGTRPRVVARFVVPQTGRVVIDLAKLVAEPNVALEIRSEGSIVVERESTGPGFTRSHAILR